MRCDDLPGGALADAWAEFVGRYRWDCFATLTWRSGVGLGEESAIKSFRFWLWRWMACEAVRLGLARWESQRLRGRWAKRHSRGQVAAVPIWVVGIERHRSRRIHLHALLKYPVDLGDMSRRTGWSIWYDLHGRARLERPRSQGDVAGYVSKYVAKGGDVVVSESFNAARLPIWEPGGKVP